MEQYEDLPRRAGSRGNSHYKHSEAVLRRDQGICYLCRQSGAGTIDHFIPWVFGGSDHPDNLKAAHKSCNSSKGSELPEGWEQAPERCWEAGFGPEHIERARQEREQSRRQALQRETSAEIDRAREELKSILARLEELEATKTASILPSDPPSAKKLALRKLLTWISMVTGWGFLILAGFLALMWLSSPTWLTFLMAIGSFGLAFLSALVFAANDGLPSSEIHRQKALAEVDEVQNRIARFRIAVTRSQTIFANPEQLICTHGLVRRFSGGPAESSTTKLDWAGMFCRSEPKCPPLWFTTIPEGHRYTTSRPRTRSRYRRYPYRRY